MSTAATRRGARDVLFALAASAVVFDLAVLAWGETPAQIAYELYAGTWGTAYGTGQVVFKATSTLLAAIAARIALRTGLFAIGIEGSIALAALAVGALAALLPAAVPSFVAWPLLLAVAAAVGGAWAMPAALLRARFGVHEVISGIMLNRIATAIVGYGLAHGLAEKASVHTRAMPPGAMFPRLSTWRGLHSTHGSALNASTLLAIGVVVVVAYLARRTVTGRELRAVGASSTVAAATGIAVRKRWALALGVAGAIAGLCAANDVMGVKGYAEEGVGAGTGFAGLAAALLGGDSALGLVLASLLLATLSQGGLAINARVPRELVDALTGVVLLLVATAPRWGALVTRLATRGRAAPVEGT